jgi:hypothetical protein
MAISPHLALVCDITKSTIIGIRQLTSVCAALQRQIMRDFMPIWGISATIDPFVNLEHVPLGYWPIIVQDKMPAPDAAGLHEDHMGQPFSLVLAGDYWSLAASHEMLEMLVDPFGNRTISGPDPEVKPGQQPGTVEFLLEVCDPCEDVDCAYAINGVPVSDFYTPHYFDQQKASSVRYDYTDHISKPRQVLPNGYLTWHDPLKDRWRQLRHFHGSKKTIVPLDSITSRKGNVRSAVDAATASPIAMVGADFNQKVHCPRGVCAGCAMFSNAINSGAVRKDKGNSKSSLNRALQADAESLQKEITNT